MELRQLKCFVVCAQTQSFSKAAAMLYTTQSNISKNIASLENELGNKLFDRKPHGITLTKKGTQIYKYALSMVECSNHILDCAEESNTEELRISFQSSFWFASAFCDFYIQHGCQEKKYYMTSASLDEIIRRLSNGLDQMGYAFVDENQLIELQDILKSSHIGYYILKESTTVLYGGGKMTSEFLEGKEDIESIEIPVIQGSEENYFAASAWKDKKAGQIQQYKPKVVITTNSDYIMQEILQRTQVSNISPRYLEENISASQREAIEIEESEMKVQFVCMFRNDQKLEPFPKQFLAFIKNHLK